MGDRHRKTESGRGGKLGRSHMTGGHWSDGGDVKDWANRLRRVNDRCVIDEGIDDCRCGDLPTGFCFDPAWRSADVVGLAASIANTEDFTGLPVLGDALIDAGCDDEAILRHCRDVSAHMRGCWLIDSILRRW